MFLPFNLIIDRSIHYNNKRTRILHLQIQTIANVMYKIIHINNRVNCPITKLKGRNLGLYKGFL